MSLLSRALAPLKSVTPADMGEFRNGTYVEIEDLRRITGMGISSQAALNYIAIYQCVRVLSNTFAQLPLKLYRRLPGGGKAEATDHPLYRVLHLQPHPDLTSFVWRKIAMRHIATWGNHYSEIVRDRIGRLQLWPLRPDVIEPRWGDDGRKEYWKLGQTGGRSLMRPGSIFHMQGQTSDGLVGSSPIDDLRATLSLSKTTETYGNSVFNNGARPAVVLSHPDTLSPPAITRLAAQMDELRGSRNAGKTVVLEEGTTITPVGFPPEAAQFIETRLLSHRLVYGAYGIPPHKVGDLERATFSNIEHQALEYIQDGMMPWLVNAEQEFAVQLIGEDEPDVFAEFSVDGYLRGDAKTRAEALAIRWQHGTLNADEWRALENENPLPDGQGQGFYTPVNYAAGGAEPEPIAESPPRLSVVKSMFGRFDCPDCGKLVNRKAVPGSVGICRSCKAEKTMPEAKSAGDLPEPEPDPLKLAIIALASREQRASEVHFHEGSIKSGDIHVPATQIAEGAVQVNLSTPETVVNVPKQAPPTVNVNVPKPVPMIRTVVRDAQQKIVGFSDTPSEEN